MGAWQPLQQPAVWAAEFAGWRPLLESEGTKDAIFQDAAAAGDAYYTLVSATALPRVQQAVSTGWDVRPSQSPGLTIFAPDYTGQSMIDDGF